MKPSPNRPLRVGFIGLGDQGGPMAMALLRAGYELHVWARRAEVAARFGAQGAQPAASAAELAGRVDMLCLCVRSDEDLRSVCFAEGAVAAMAPGTILAIHSTVTPQTCIEVAEAAGKRSVAAIDAPVSGGGRAAEEGRLLVMAGGEASDIERARPVFGAFADSIVPVGSVGAGQQAKMLNNLLFVANLGAALEARRLGAAFGLTADALDAVMLRGSGRSAALEGVARGGLAARAPHVGPVLQKDLDLVGRAFPRGDADEILQWARAALVRLQSV